MSVQFFIVTILIILYYAIAPYGKWNNVLTLFSALMIHGMILGAGTEFLGFIDHRIVVSLLVIFVANQNFKNQITIPFKYFDKQKKYAIYFFILFSIFIERYIEVKNSVLDIDYIVLFQETSYFTILKRLSKELLNLYALLLIFKNLYHPGAFMAIERGFFYGMILAIVSMLLFNQLAMLGFTLSGGIGEQNLRLTGFLGLNANHAASIFAMLYGYVLAQYEKKKAFSWKYIVMISLVIVGIMLTASKTGLVIFGLITGLFLLKNYQNVNIIIFRMFFILIVGLGLFQLFGDYLAYRVEEQLSGEDDTLAARIGYWISYLNDIKENPNYLIFGNLKSPTYYRSVHNTYIEVLFFTGLIPIFILFRLMYKSLKYWKYYQYNIYSFNPTYSLVALFVSWITGAGFLNFWILLMMGMSAGIPKAIVEQKIITNK